MLPALLIREAITLPSVCPPTLCVLGKIPEISRVVAFLACPMASKIAAAIGDSRGPQSRSQYDKNGAPSYWLVGKLAIAAAIPGFAEADKSIPVKSFKSSHVTVDAVTLFFCANVCPFPAGLFKKAVIKALSIAWCFTPSEVVYV